MQGRAKVNLAVVGSVEAKMECAFEEISEVQKINLPNTDTKSHRYLKDKKLVSAPTT